MQKGRNNSHSITKFLFNGSFVVLFIFTRSCAILIIIVLKLVPKIIITF